jgi:hypothetical protein
MKPSTRILASILIASAAVAQAMVAQAEDRFAAAFQNARRESLAGNYLTAVAVVRPFALTASGEIKSKPGTLERASVTSRRFQPFLGPEPPGGCGPVRPG